jgi:hypothetical protein
MSEEIPCACGCGGIVRTPDAVGRPRRFISGHNRLGMRISEVTRQRMRRAALARARRWREERGIALTRRERRALNAARAATATTKGQTPGKPPL